jgi:hypothetical protein
MLSNSGIARELGWRELGSLWYYEAYLEQRAENLKLHQGKK